MFVSRIKFRCLYCKCKKKNPILAEDSGFFSLISGERKTNEGKIKINYICCVYKKENLVQAKVLYICNLF